VRRRFRAPPRRLRSAARAAAGPAPDTHRGPRHRQTRRLAVPTAAPPARSAHRPRHKADWRGSGRTGQDRRSSPAGPNRPGESPPARAGRAARHSPRRWPALPPSGRCRGLPPQAVPPARLAAARPNPPRNRARGALADRLRAPPRPWSRSPSAGSARLARPRTRARRTPCGRGCRRPVRALPAARRVRRKRGERAHPYAAAAALTATRPAHAPSAVRHRGGRYRTSHRAGPRLRARPGRWSPPSVSERGEPLGLVFGYERVDQLGQAVAGEHFVELVQRQADAVVGHAPLREVVGTDALRTVAAADHRLARFGFCAVGFVVHLLVEPRAQHLHRLVAVAVLAAFVLHCDDDTAGDVG